MSWAGLARAAYKIGGPYTQVLVQLFEDAGNGSLEVADLDIRRVQVKWTRQEASGVADDYAMINFHLVAWSTGDFDFTWDDPGHYTAFEGAFDTLWTNLKGSYHSSVALAEYRWYLAGPDRDLPGATNPVARVTTRNVPGTSAGTTMLPPQVAMSCTLKTLPRREWGRVYFPAPVAEAGGAGQYGRLSTSRADLIANQVDTMFDTVNAAGVQPIVYSKRWGSIFTVDAVQVDDLYDVIRSRRFRIPQYRKLIDA